MLLQNKWIIFLGLAIAVVMVDIDMTAMNLVSPYIVDQLHIGLETMQWIINGYTMSAAALMAVGGRIGDIYGPGRVFLLGMLVFALASLAVGLSLNASSLILFRIIQGASIAFSFPIAIILVRQVFPPEQLGFAVSLLISVAGIAQALGPMFGGVVVTHLGWRYIFYLNIPLSIISCFIVFYAFKEKYSRQPLPFSLVPVFFLCCGLFLIMTALNNMGLWGYTSHKFLMFLLFGVASLVLFCCMEFNAANPFLELRLLFNRSFLLVNIIRVLSSFVYFGMLFSLGLFFQFALGYSILKTAYLMSAFTIVVGVFSIIAGKLIDQFGVKKALIVGHVCFIISAFILLNINLSINTNFMIMGLVFSGLAFAFLIPASATGALIVLPPEKMGAGSGILLTNSFFAASVGVAIVGGILLTDRMREISRGIQTSGLFSAGQIDWINKTFIHSQTPLDDLTMFNEQQIKLILSLAHDGITLAFNLILWLNVILISASLLTCFLLKNNDQIISKEKT